MATTPTRPSHGHRTSTPNTSDGTARRTGGPGGNGGGGRGGSVPPQRRRRKRQRPNPFLAVVKFLFSTILLLALLGVAICAGIFLATVKNMPQSMLQIENYRPAGRTLIYSADGALMADIHQQNRQMVTIDKIPKQLQDATVAIEDSRFYSNHGVDFRGIGRALFKDVRGGDITAQGGSTITQQLVRNLHIGGLTSEKSLTRKIREAVYAIEIEKNYSKQQILEMYLNEVYYGSGAYGVQAAAETYFGKTVDQLDLAQCAMIAGLPQRPTYYSPYVNKDAAKTRRDIVLARMKELGYITDDQYQQSVDEGIVLAFPKAPSGGSKTYHAPYFVDYVTKYLTQRYGSDFVYRGGIKVYTTLNWQMQQAAENAVTQHLADVHYTGATQAALVCLEPATGYIKAMVGGVDYSKSQYNIAADGRRQPGSSFKPIIYTAALDSGIITEKTRILDEPITLPGGNGTRWTPHNDDDRYRGWITATEAVAMSVNVAAVKVLQKVGVDTAVRYAQMMGVRSPLAPYLTLALGASAVTPLEMADVYATIDNGGARPITTPIEQITDDSNQVLEDDVPKLETTSISADALNQMKDMLRAVVTSGTAYASFRDNNPPNVYGKTGTTQNHLDVWFDGFTKDLVTVVWAGHPSVDPKTKRPVYGIPLSHEAFGATVCAPIWKTFMISALAIEQQAIAREAALHKTKQPIIIPANQPQGDQTGTSATGSTSGNGSDDSDTGYGADDNTDVFNPSNNDQNDNSAGTATGDGSGQPVGSPSGDQNGSASDTTTTIWVDNDTGLPTKPNAPNSHPETFAKGYAPQTPNTDSGTPDNGNLDNSGGGAQQDDSGSPTQQRTQHRQSSTTAANISSPRLVTVTVCAESGLLATKWCPETISETFVAGTQPKRYCQIHQPPPGER